MNSDELKRTAARVVELRTEVRRLMETGYDAGGQKFLDLILRLDTERTERGETELTKQDHSPQVSQTADGDGTKPGRMLYDKSNMPAART